MPEVRLVNVTKRYGRIVANDHVTLTIKNGEYVSVIGPSGCGKTTLIKNIAGIITPDEGEIHIDGELVNDLPIEDRGIGYVFQNIALFPHMTVWDNITYGPRVKGWSHGETTPLALEMLEMIKLGARSDAFPSELSGGTQQKTAVARALMSRAKLLLFDEPLGALDIKVRAELRYELRRLVEDLGLTALHVTHDQEEAMSISDLLVVMDHGVVKQIGPPTEIYQNPIDEFVANFIGHVNFFPGEVVAFSGNEMSFQISQGKLKLEMPLFPVSVGDRLKGVVRPESIDIVAAEKEVTDTDNVMEGLVEGAMYIGSVMRFTITSGGQTVYVDEADPQYRGMFQEGQRVKLILSKIPVISPR